MTPTALAILVCAAVHSSAHVALKGGQAKLAFARAKKLVHPRMRPFATLRVTGKLCAIAKKECAKGMAYCGMDDARRTLEARTFLEKYPQAEVLVDRR